MASSIYKVETFVNESKVDIVVVRGDSPKQLALKFSQKYFKNSNINFVRFKITNKYGKIYNYTIYLDRINNKLVVAKEVVK